MPRTRARSIAELNRRIRDEFRGPRGRQLSRFIAEYILKKNYEDFIAKSAHGQDRDGERWDELLPAYARSKARKRAGSARARTLLNNALARGGLASIAARQAAQVPETAATNVPINIDTHALERSLRPVGATNQVMEFKANGRGAKVRTTIDYAKHVNKVRPIYPTTENVKKWTKEAVIIWLKEYAF